MKTIQIHYAILMLLGVLCLTGCASSKPPTAASLGPDFALPAPGKANVIFIRPGHFAYQFHFDMHDGGILIGRSSSSEYFAYECDPGHHVFSTSMENLAYLDADLSPGRIYYVRVRAKEGMWVSPRVKMMPLYPGCPDIDWAKLPEIVAGLERTAPVTAEEAQHDKKGMDNYLVRLRSYQADHKNGGTILPEYGQTTTLVP